ncbi:coiled-coil domain-containing protein 106-like [Scomber japonicus]|uniref:coiled-coil domain-containing protein 106-like n=1 Tax=Scomber japonicus TaxID=13676 RepID=UPI0023066596|nr:coiled-coil domain-containing protein 106-like [Scomber japonicus]
MAPTAKLQNQKHKHELDLAKVKIACQEDMIKELTKERDFLKEQLSLASRNTNMRNDEPPPEASVASASDLSGSSESSYSSSTNPSSDSSFSSSSSSSSTSDDGKKKKRKKSKKNIKKKKGKKGTREKRSKTIRRSCVSRARGPDEVIARYRKVLKAYKKKNSIIAACKMVGVDRNTVALNAPIAELAIAAPEKFAEFKDEHTRKHKLGDFAAKCIDAIRDSPDIDSTVQALKKSGKLLPVGKRNF